MRKLVPILALGALTACTPSQHQAWLEWFDQDPSAAIEFAQSGCGGLSCSVDESDEPDVAPAPDFDDGGAYWPWDALAQCESGGNWHIDTGNGFYGGLQFAWGSWEAAGGSGNPADASVSEQIHRGEILQDMQGWGAWPTCARQVGLL